MVATKELLRQFHLLGVKPSIWAKAEIRELANVLVPGERLTHVVFGWYENSFALLCCTEHRVLLIDKRPFFLKLEDVRYDKISEIKFLNRLLDSSVILSYAGMKLEFRSWSQSALRKLTSYVQETIMRINRQQWQVPMDDYEDRDQWQSQPVSSGSKVEPQHIQAVVAEEPSQGVTSYPQDLVRQASIDLGLASNPYATTHKFMRRRIPLVGFNQSSR